MSSTALQLMSAQLIKPMNQTSQKPYGYWTFERCLEDAKRFNSRNQWDRNSRGAFQSARRNGWMDLCMPKGN